jgi:hypothetical protein
MRPDTGRSPGGSASVSHSCRSSKPASRLDVVEFLDVARALGADASSMIAALERT